MEVLKKYGINLLVWIVVAGMIFIRLTSYGDLSLSVANGDTETYVQGGAAPLFSKDMLTKSRLFTTNLLYYLADVQECEIKAISYPALRTETYRAIQPCFDAIVFFQNIVSVIAWSLLALVVSKRLNGANIPEIKPILVFTTDEVELNAGNSPIAVLKLKQLKEFMQQGEKNCALNAEQIKTLTDR